MSIGAATLIPDKNKDIKELFSLADSHLYQAKENGRNGVVSSVSNDNFTLVSRDS